MINLKKVLEENPLWENNTSQLRAALADFYPNNRRDINVVVSLKECGITDKIKMLSVIDREHIELFSKILENEYGIQNDYAQEAIKVWADVYNIEVEDFEINLLTHDEILQKYFTEKNHIYKIENATVTTKGKEVEEFTINSKHLIFQWKIKGTKNYSNNIYGNQYHSVWYRVDNYTVDLRVKPNRSNDTPEPFIQVTFENKSDLGNFISFLQCVGKEMERFSIPFDESIIPENSMENEEDTYYEFFCDRYVKPISFTARCVDHNDSSEDGICYKELGICDVTIGLDTDISYSDAIGDDWGNRRFEMKIVQKNGSGTQSSMNIEMMKWDVYLNKRSNSMFIGSGYEYQAFVIDDDRVLQNVFNYVAALCSQHQFYLDDVSDSESDIEEQTSLDIYMEDFLTTKNIQSCCSIIDICYKYAANTENEYSHVMQEKYLSICVEYLEKLKKLPKHNKIEKTYTYLASYILGTLYFWNGYLDKSVKEYKESLSWNEIDKCEHEWPDDIIEMKIALHSNLYFLYKILDIDFGMKVEKVYIEKDLEPSLNLYKKRVQEMKIEMSRNPNYATQSYGNDNDRVGKVTNQQMFDYYNKLIEKITNWENYPMIRYIDVSFSDYGSFSSSSLAEAVYENKWDGVSISSVNNECEFIIAGNSVKTNPEYSFNEEKTVISDLNLSRKMFADKVKLLYLKN